jgi:hypothetical protein
VSSFSFSRLADYFRAVAALDAAHDPKKQRAIAEILGLAGPVATPVSQKIVAADVVLPPTRDTLSARLQATVTITAALTTGPTRQPRQRRKAVTFSIQPVPARALERPAWLDEAEILEPPRNASAAPAAPRPLLERRASRAILSTAMATQTETNQVDVQALLDAEVEGRTLLRVPRRVVPGLSRGIQVIVDRGPAAAPFDTDQKQLIEQIRAVGGREMVSIVEIDPSRDFLAAGGQDEWGDYFTRYRAMPHVAVALVSDLGIAQVPFERTAGAEEWARFISRIRAGGNPVIAFVPYAPARWPSILLRRAALVQWDRDTTVQSVRRALRRSSR